MARRDPIAAEAARLGVGDLFGVKSRTKVETGGASVSKLVNKYDAAGMGRRIASWNPPSSGPNLAINNTEKLRNRSRDAYRNEWSGRAGVQRWATSLVGTGIVPRFLTPNAREQWKKWLPFADADGVLDFYGLQTLAVKTWLGSDECFARIRYRRANSGLNVPVQVQLLESDYVPRLNADTYTGLPPGNTIRSGIERNRIGQRVAYWMYRDHPGDGVMRNDINASLLVRVPADEVIHLFEPERPGQLRGVSQMAPILARLRNIADYDDAVLDRQKLANLFTLFITRALPQEGDFERDPQTGLPVWYGDDNVPVVAMQPGLTQELQPGESVQFANPPEAGTTFSDYMRTQHMGTAAGLGIPYEIFSGDIREISDRTLRVIVNEYRRFAEQRQHQNVIPMFCAKFARAWMLAGRLAGVLTAADIASEPEWAPHGWQYIHPVQDVQGKQLEVQAGFRSRTSVITERGDDPEVVDTQRAADQQRAEKLGIKDPLAPVPAEDDEGDDSPAKKKEGK